MVRLESAALVDDLEQARQSGLLVFAGKGGDLGLDAVVDLAFEQHRRVPVHITEDRGDREHEDEKVDRGQAEGRGLSGG
jgi:hypothetical protein